MLSDACSDYLHDRDIRALIESCQRYGQEPFSYGDEVPALLVLARAAGRDPAERASLDELALLVRDFYDSPPPPLPEEARRAFDALKRELAEAASAALGRPVLLGGHADGKG